MINTNYKNNFIEEIKNNKLLILILRFILSSCGIGFLGIGTENTIYKNSTDIKFKKNTCMSLGFLTFGCTQYLEEKSDENKNYIKEKIDKVDISLQTLNNSKVKIISLGLLPLIPAPPIIPTFFFPAMGYKEFCGGENYKIKLVFENKFNTLNNIEIDLNSIYLLNGNKKIYANGFENISDMDHNNFSEKTYIINFPITCKETKNSLIFVNNIKIDNQNISLPAGKIVYQSNWMFMMGYFINN